MSSRPTIPVVLERGAKDAGRIRAESSTTVDPTCSMMEVRGEMCQLVEYWQELLRIEPTF